MQIPQLIPIFELFYENKNITKDVSQYVTSIEYTDIEHGESDELQISFEDSEKLWQGNWIPCKGDCLRAYIGYEAEKLLNCGIFEIDELEFSTPPDTITVKGLATGIKKPLKDKFYSMPDIGEQVVCLMDENSEDGVILGAIYSTEDVSISQSEKELSINLENGSSINANKDTNTLTVVFENMRLVGNIQHEGTFTNTNGIISQSDITDKTSSMQVIRDIYNTHTHTGNQGSPTSKPDKSM